MTNGRQATVGLALLVGVATFGFGSAGLGSLAGMAAGMHDSDPVATRHTVVHVSLRPPAPDAETHEDAPSQPQPAPPPAVAVGEPAPQASQPPAAPQPPADDAVAEPEPDAEPEPEPDAEPMPVQAALAPAPQPAVETVATAARGRGGQAERATAGRPTAGSSKGPSHAGAPPGHAQRDRQPPCRGPSCPDR
jgi:outer membrane biosynthesis protein TonB